MDRAHELLEAIKQRGQAKGHFLGLLNILIGRRIARADGTLVSQGLTWRELALRLKKARWDRGFVRELGLDPARLPPRGRERYWYAVIAQSAVDSNAATRAGDCLARELQKVGYVVGPAPGSPVPGNAAPAEEKG